MDLILHIMGLAFIPLILITIYFSCEEIYKNIEEHFHYKEKVAQYFMLFVVRLEKSHAELRNKNRDNTSFKGHY